MRLASVMFVLAFVIMFLTLYTILGSNFAISQQNLGSGSGSNVTEDMINLLSNISGSSHENENEIANDTTNKISEFSQQNASDHHITFTNPESIILGSITLSEGSSINLRYKPIFYIRRTFDSKSAL
ncbi:MAG: hypothetical protein P0116_10190 [Candidatus Nitrosocosmicus sp.]|nr:hypothetical protein [Candidatus Nitrosocosmicus sp.]